MSNNSGIKLYSKVNEHIKIYVVTEKPRDATRHVGLLPKTVKVRTRINYIKFNSLFVVLVLSLIHI